MTIRKRILKSNTWIVFLSLLTLLIIGGTVIFIFEDTYVRTLLPQTKLQENLYNVQTIMNRYSFKNNTFVESDYEQLKNSLAQYDYQLYITQNNNKVLFSNIRNNQHEAIEILQSEIEYSDKSELYVWEDKTIVARRIAAGAIDYDMIAVNSTDKGGILKLSRGTFEMLMLSFLIVGIGSILIIMVISRFFTNRLVNQIMIPVIRLIDGAKRIEQGNLDEPVVYSGENEFEMVCRSFNNMQESLKEGMEKNASYEKARTELVSGISHDLRTPLTSVKGYIKGVKDGIANTQERQEFYLDIAYKKACEMDVLLQKLFYFSKLETGNMPLYPIKLQFLTFIKEFLKENEKYYQEKGLEFTLSATGENHDIKIDKDQVSRVIANIIDNSIKYKISDKVHILIEVTGTTDMETLTITDNGEGVTEEKLPYIFDQFFRADEARSSKKNGSGLGLYIAKYIIEQHGGSISAKNNSGLSIEISLPKKGL